MLGNYSKAIGALVGGVFGVLVSRYGLPDAWATPEIQGAVTVLLSAACTWAFPANKPS
jgi:hypothetical protein